MMETVTMTYEKVAQVYNLDENEDVIEFLYMHTKVIAETNNTVTFLREII